MNNRLFLATMFKLRFDIGEWLAVNGDVSLFNDAQTNVWSACFRRKISIFQGNKIG
ncbi:MAG: hypothetical protein IID16_06765 [Candidatus Marinimicrobia bacterium]|nr:hypothetical protein [Candidatus Neomarinimicrobiota bacterium]